MIHFAKIYLDTFAPPLLIFKLILVCFIFDVFYSTCFILRVFYDIQVFCLFNFRYTHTQNTQHIPTVGRPRIHNSKLFFSRKNVNRIVRMGAKFNREKTEKGL